MRFGGGAGSPARFIIGSTITYNDTAESTRHTALLGGETTDAGSDGGRDGILPIPCTLSLLIVDISSNAKTDTVTLHLRVNSVSVNQTLSIGAGLIGQFQDITNIDVTVTGDRINLLWDTLGAGAPLALTSEMSSLVCVT